MPLTHTTHSKTDSKKVAETDVKRVIKILFLFLTLQNHQGDKLRSNSRPPRKVTRHQGKHRFSNYAGPYTEGKIFYRRYRDKYYVQWSLP